MRFIDTHTHITDEAYKPDERSQVIDRALQAGVFKMILADIDASERDEMLSLCDEHKGVLYPMLGLYPGSVNENWQKELDIIYSLSTTRTFAAIGEVGLDYHQGKEYSAQQKDALVCQLELASKLDLPVNIHLRDATDDFLDVLIACRGLGLRGNLHAFSGSADFFRRIQSYGDWSVGIGGVLTFKNAGIAQEIVDIPIEKIVLETDAPYLAPVPKRGTRNESANIPLIAQRLAERKRLSVEKVAQQTTENALKLFPAIV